MPWHRKPIVIANPDEECVELCEIPLAGKRSYQVGKRATVYRHFGHAIGLDLPT